MPARSAALASWIARTSFCVIVSRVAALVEDVGERAAVGHDAAVVRGQIAADRAVGVDDAGEEHLGDGVDDPGPADARDVAWRRTRLVGPGVGADDLAPRLERAGIDAHPLDGAGRRPLAAADLGALEGRPGRAGRGEQAVRSPSTISALVPTSTSSCIDVAAVRTLGQHRGRGVGADVAGDARPDVERGVAAGRGRARQPQPSTGSAVASTNGAEPERRRIDAEHEVVHDRVADEHDLEHAVAAVRRRRRASSPTSSSMARRIVAVSSTSPPSFIIT